MDMTTTLAKVRMALRVTTTAFDDEITDLIEAALLDLQIAGIEGDQVVAFDKLVLRAVITYCRMYFGSPDDFDRLAKAYETQKGQLWTATGYTVWPDGVA